MTGIEEMIAELCPNGVEWKELGEVTELKRGKTITAKTAIEGPYPVISGGQKPAYYHREYNRNGETITVAGSGAYAGFLAYWNEPIFVSDAFSIKVYSEDIELRFVYHFLLSNQYRIYNMKSGSGVPHVYAKDVAKIKIPIPPLEIQEKIVQILDKFTEYVTELTAELTLRQQQYTYFRDYLLNFDEDGSGGANNKVEWKTLGEIAENLDRLRKPVTKGSRSNGTYPYYGASGIVDYVDDFIFDGDYLLISEDGANLMARKTPIAFSASGKVWVNNHAHVLKFANEINQKFVQYYLNDLELSQYISGGTQPKLNQQNLNSIKIPYPKMEIQEKIVHILDNFDTVCHDLNIGLPKEIELRQKQYEYFREKLLTYLAEGEYHEDRIGEGNPSTLILLQWVFGVVRVKFSAVINLERGKRLVRRELESDGRYPVYQNSLTPLGYYKEANRPSQTTFIVCAGNAGEIGYSYTPFWAADDVFTLSSSEYVLQKFMYYSLLNKQKKIKSQVRKASIPRLSKISIENILLYLPTLEKQAEIVEILDKFNMLTNSISDGLPKEIELRQKQYEYWREQLLKF